MGRENGYGCYYKGEVTSGKVHYDANETGKVGVVLQGRIGGP